MLETVRTLKIISSSMVFISSSLLLARWKRIFQTLKWHPFFPPSRGENLLQIWEMFSQTSWIPSRIFSFSVRSSPEIEQSWHLEMFSVSSDIVPNTLNGHLSMYFLRTYMKKTTSRKWPFAECIGEKEKILHRDNSPKEKWKQTNQQTYQIDICAKTTWKKAGAFY